MGLQLLARAGAAVLASLFIGVALSGCAITYDGNDGARRIIGLVDLQIAPAGQDQTLAGQVVSVKSLGALISSHDGQTTLGLGYTSETTAGIKNNSYVRGNPVFAAETFFEGDSR